MIDRHQLSTALRAAAALREKAIVVTAGAGAPVPDLASDLSALRTIGARPIAVCAGAAEAAALSLALSLAGERPAALPGASIAKAGPAGGMPVVDGLLLTQLAALGYVPVTAPPVAAPGGPSPEGGAPPSGEVAADLLAAGVAIMVGAERLVYLDCAPEAAARALLSAMGRPLLEARGSLLLALLTPVPAPGGAS